MSSQITETKQLNEDKYLDSTLRPPSFEEYMGQDKTKDNLKILIEAAKKGMNQLIIFCYAEALD